MKKCTKCDMNLSIFAFGKRTASKDGRKFVCRSCEKKVRRHNYIKYKERISKENKRGHKKRKQTFYNNIREYLNLSKEERFECEVCDYQNILHAPFDWHHVVPKNKLYEISAMVRHTKTKLFKELDKCVLLCSNCHRLLHYEEN